MPEPTPRYAIGDRVALTDAANGWRDAPATVLRVTLVAPLPSQSARYLYELEVQPDRARARAFEDALAPLPSTDAPAPADSAEGR